MWIVLALIGGILVGVAAFDCAFSFGFVHSCHLHKRACYAREIVIGTPVSLSGSGKESGRPATWAAGGSANPERDQQFVPRLSFQIVQAAESRRLHHVLPVHPLAPTKCLSVERVRFDSIQFFDRRYSGWRRGFGRIFSC